MYASVSGCSPSETWHHCTARQCVMPRIARQVVPVEVTAFF